MDKLPEGVTEPRWIAGSPTLSQVTADIARPMEGKPGKLWYVLFAIAALGLLDLLGMATWLIAKGIGVWGLNNSVGWAFDITNFVFWIGIGHAGTLISAILAPRTNKRDLVELAVDRRRELAGAGSAG